MKEMRKSDYFYTPNCARPDDSSLALLFVSLFPGMLFGI